MPPSTKLSKNRRCKTCCKKGTLDVFYKIIHQVAFQERAARLLRDTNAGLALVIPTVGILIPWYDILPSNILTTQFSQLTGKLSTI
ncbi:hypothetical protein L2E82_51079 [Cichorium intybus]|nr:hypothetical protein L2E82_51079 [Cichorium intybus]